MYGVIINVHNKLSDSSQISENLFAWLKPSIYLQTLQLQEEYTKSFSLVGYVLP